MLAIRHPVVTKTVSKHAAVGDNPSIVDLFAVLVLEALRVFEFDRLRLLPLVVEEGSSLVMELPTDIVETFEIFFGYMGDNVYTLLLNIYYTYYPCMEKDQL